MSINSKELFFQSKNFSSKWEKYFDVYDICFEKYKKKKITFVEVGILNGGSLEIWKKYFHPESRIIGIDFNPECKKFEKEGFEIYIGDQSDENFWDDFYKKIGKIDILLDDGGHRNIQQSITTIKSIPNINDNGILMIEDTHTSYLREFGNPNKYSFISFTKKLIDDLNYKCPNLGSFKLSLNNFIYYIQYFESIVVFHIDTEKTYANKIIENKSQSRKIVTEVDVEGSDTIKDFRYYNTVIEKILRNKLIYKFKFLKKYKFVDKCYRFILVSIIYIVNLKNIKLYKKFFK